MRKPGVRPVSWLAVMHEEPVFGRHRTGRSMPVFVDRSGRRLRLARAAGVTAAAGCATFVAVVIGGSLAGPSIDLPHLPGQAAAAQVGPGSGHATRPGPDPSPTNTDSSRLGVPASAGPSVGLAAAYKSSSPGSASAGLLLPANPARRSAAPTSRPSSAAATQSAARPAPSPTAAPVRAAQPPTTTAPVRTPPSPVTGPPSTPPSAGHGRSSAAPGHTKSPHR